MGHGIVILQVVVRHGMPPVTVRHTGLIQMTRGTIPVVTIRLGPAKVVPFLIAKTRLEKLEGLYRVGGTDPTKRPRRGNTAGRVRGCGHDEVHRGGGDINNNT